MPEETGPYVFYSTANVDTYGYLYNEEWNQVDSDDDNGEGNNFRLKHSLNAGEQYYFGARYYSSDSSGIYDVHLEPFTGLMRAWAEEEDLYVAPNGQATLTVEYEFIGDGEPTYQWYKYNKVEDASGAIRWNGSILEGETERTYTIESVSEYSRYYCRVSDDYGNGEDVDFYVYISNYPFRTRQLSDGTLEIEKYLGDEAEVVIPDAFEEMAVTSIGEDAFYDCTTLTKVTIPEGVTTIKEAAFCECANLTEVQLPESLRSIGNAAFSGCRILEYIAIPSGLESMGATVFNDCTSLRSISIPGGIGKIRGYSFFGCIGLETVIIGNGIGEIGDHAFYACISLDSITIPGSVTAIGDYAFYGCKKLSADIIPATVSQLGDEVFKGMGYQSPVEPSGEVQVHTTYVTPGGIKDAEQHYRLYLQLNLLTAETDEEAFDAEVRIAANYVAGAQYEEALDILDSYDPETLNASQRFRLYNVYSRVYEEDALNDPERYQYYVALRNEQLHLLESE